MTGISQEAVRVFFENLRTALYDKRLENEGYRLIFYVDADVAVRMLAGFEDPGTSERERLVRALMACGFCGPLELLRSHALEFSDYIAMRARQMGPRGSGYNDRVKEFLLQSGLTAEMTRILEATNAVSGESNPHTEKRFLECVRRGGPSAFVGLESALGPWPRRLRRLYGSVIRAEELGPEMRQLIAESGGLPGRFMSALRAAQGTPYRSATSDYRDACALTGLYWQRRRGEREFSKTLVRFYTETGVLREVFASASGVGDELCYKSDYVDLSGVDTAARGILRSADYFLMRCRFPQLAFGSRGRTNTDRLDLIIKGIEDHDILELEDAKLRNALEEFEVEGQSLASIITEFEELRLVKAIWSNGRVPEAVLQSLPEWADVIAVLMNEETADRVEERIEDIQEDLGRRVERLRVWMGDFETVTQLTESPRHHTALNALEVLDPVAAEAQLGMRRWGIALGEAEREHVVRVLSHVSERGSVDRHRVCQDVATSMERAREDGRDIDIVCAVLWGLGGYSRVAEMLDAVARKRPLTLDYRILREAAALRAELGLNLKGEEWVQQWDDTLDELQKGCDGVDESRRGEMRIGIAYLAFHLSRIALRRKKRSSRLDDAQMRWTTLSRELGEAAKEALEENDLPWALAVNHCLYVGVRSAAGEEDIVANHTSLRSCETRPVWNARFADTVACYYVWRLKRRMGDYKVVEMEGDLVEARRYLDAAKAGNIGDIAVAEHEGELHEVEAMVEGARR